MIGKIFNWLGGGFFRTIGRFIAFIVLGFFAATILSKKEINITDLLGIETIKAATYTSEVRQQSSTTFSINNTSDFTCQYDYCEYEIQASDSAAITSKSISISNYDTTQYDVVAFNFVISNPISTGGTQSSAICTEWQAGGTYYNCSNITATGGTGVVQNHDINNLGLLVRATYADNSSGFCSLENNKIYCPTYKKQISTIEIIANQKTRWITYILVRVYRVAENYNYATTSDAIEQQTEDIIQSQENQTQTIIENQENQTQQQIESQQVCQYIDKGSVVEDGKYLNVRGNITETNNWGISDYIKIDNKTKITLLTEGYGQTPSTCFYNVNKTLISCIVNINQEQNSDLTIPSGSNYVRFSINTYYDKPQYNICKNGNQAMNDYMTDTDMTETNSTATSFFDNFSDSDHGGLSSIITAPLTVINSMLSNTCVAPSATWKGATITLPCGNMFWDRPGASDLRDLLNVFYGGFVCYYAIRRLFLLIENMKDPTHDKIEVADL